MIKMRHDCWEGVRPEYMNDCRFDCRFCFNKYSREAANRIHLGTMVSSFRPFFLLSRSSKNTHKCVCVIF